MRGGDAGWGHKQGEAEEEKAVRESPALEHTATTRRAQSESSGRAHGGLAAGGSRRRRGHELNREPGIVRHIPVKIYSKGV